MPRRILLLITDLQIGGTPTVVRELAVRLREPGRVEVEVACLAGWGPVADQLQAGGVRVTALGATSVAAFPRTLWRLIRLIRRGRFDTVFSFLIHANATAAAAKLFFPGVRFLQSIQTTQPEPRWHWRLQRLIQPAADGVVVPSPSAAHVARRWAGVAASRVVLIPNGVDCATAGASTVPMNDPRPYPIGFLGRLDPIKRVPDLLEAVARLDGLVLLHVFGEGHDRSRIEAEIRRLGIDSSVTLHGATIDAGAALRQVGLLVLPSQAEGFGLVLIEAMAWMVPIVATDAPGIRDVVLPDQNGLLVPVADPPALAAAIRSVVQSPALRERLVGGARNWVVREYNLDAIADQYRRLLRLPKRSRACR